MTMYYIKLVDTFSLYVRFIAGYIGCKSSNAYYISRLITLCYTFSGGFVTRCIYVCTVSIMWVTGIWVKVKAIRNEWCPGRIRLKANRSRQVSLT